jgi:hypothetical protein
MSEHIVRFPLININSVSRHVSELLRECKRRGGVPKSSYFLLSISNLGDMAQSYPKQYHLALAELYDEMLRKEYKKVMILT